MPSDLWKVVISTPSVANKGLDVLAAFWVRGTCCWIRLGGLSTRGFCLVLLEGCPMHPRWGHWPIVSFIFLPVGFGCGALSLFPAHSCVPMAEQEGCSPCVLKRSNFYLTWLPCVMPMNALPPYQLEASLLACAVETGRKVSAGFQLFWVQMCSIHSECIWLSRSARSITASMAALSSETVITRWSTTSNRSYLHGVSSKAPGWPQNDSGDLYLQQIFYSVVLKCGKCWFPTPSTMMKPWNIEMCV